MSVKKAVATNKKPAVKKAAAAPAAKLIIETEGENVEGGKIRNILQLFGQGFKPKDIIALGYNKNTVYVQTNALKKLQAGPALEYYGQSTWEANVQAIMRKSKISRQDAVKKLNARLDEMLEDEEGEGEE